MSIKSPKNNNNIIKDISKSRLNINWNTNPSFNLYLPPLQNCRDKKNIFTDNSSNKLSCKRNLKTNDYCLNMTINNILDKMEKKRKDNKSSVDSFFKITDSLDKTTDISNTQIIKYDSKTKPINIYGEAKLTGERLTKLYAKSEGLNYVVVRPSGVYGPGDLPDRVVSKFFDTFFHKFAPKVLSGLIWRTN